MIALGTYMKTYRVGDIVDIKANGAVQKGVRLPFPHPRLSIARARRTFNPNAVKDQETETLITSEN